MTTKHDTTRATEARLDRPSPMVPSVDQAWDAPVAATSGKAFGSRDLSRHRVYHTLYEDMLN